MPRPVRAVASNDLFQMFPDLPRPRRRRGGTQRAGILDLVAAARARVAENVKRQLEASQRAREVIAARQQNLSGRRRSTVS